jgi:hypothetical protein
MEFVYYRSKCQKKHRMEQWILRYHYSTNGDAFICCVWAYHDKIILVHFSVSTSKVNSSRVHGNLIFLHCTKQCCFSVIGKGLFYVFRKKGWVVPSFVLLVATLRCVILLCFFFVEPSLTTARIDRQRGLAWGDGCGIFFVSCWC